MSNFSRLEQHQRPAQELTPQQHFGLYGQPSAPYVPPDPAPYPEAVLAALPQTTRSRAATRALILGMTSLFLGALTGIPAILYGHLAYREIKRSSQKSGLFQAIAGLVLGYCSLPLSVLYLLLLSGSIHY